MSDRLSQVLAEGPPPTNGVFQRVLDFVGALRRAGVGTTQSEAIEAVRALPHVDLLDRAMLREALASVTVSSQLHRRAFDDLFEVYFPARSAPTEDPPESLADVMEGEGEQPDPDAFMQDLVDQIMEADDEAIRRMAREAVEQFGMARRHDGGTSYYQYRVFRAVRMHEILESLLRRKAHDEETVTPMQERLWRDEFEARMDAFRQEVESEIRRRAAADRGVEEVADRLTRPPVEELDFFRLKPDEQAQMRAQIRPLARKLATRTAVKRKQGRDGKLDVRRTVRASMSTGGVPFEPAFRPRRHHKPELFLVCDVSGSVAAFARFTLMLVHTLQEQFAKVRSFAFIDTLDEVTSLFESGDFAEGMRRMMTEADLVWIDGHSDYGHSLDVFHSRHADDITARSTVIVLGDARNNHRAPNAWVLRDLQRRARRTYWLNPEPMRYWQSGDSIVAEYARYVDEMVECRNLKQLTRFVEQLT